MSGTDTPQLPQALLSDSQMRSCCITGLYIPELNRPSHIVPWAENKSIRLDPSNGLCLSATYDLAFDRHLITLDEDYRLVVSRSVTEHYTKDVVKDYFHKREGDKIYLPKTYKPKQEYLMKHRMAFAKSG